MIKPNRNRYYSSGNVMHSMNSPVYNNAFNNHYQMQHPVHLNASNQMYQYNFPFHENRFNYNQPMMHPNYMMQGQPMPQIFSPLNNRSLNNPNFSYNNSPNSTYSGNNSPRFIPPKKNNSTSNVLSSFKSVGVKSKKSSLFNQQDEDYESFDELIDKINSSLAVYIKSQKGSR
jgi:hypothetical protein